MLIRHAVAALDASACAAIYRPFVEFSVASLEERPPTANEFAGRIEGEEHRLDGVHLEVLGDGLVRECRDIGANEASEIVCVQAANQDLGHHGEQPRVVGGVRRFEPQPGIGQGHRILGRFEPIPVASNEQSESGCGDGIDEFAGLRVVESGLRRQEVDQVDTHAPGFGTVSTDAIKQVADDVGSIHGEVEWSVGRRVEWEVKEI